MCIFTSLVLRGIYFHQKFNKHFTYYYRVFTFKIIWLWSDAIFNNLGNDMNLKWILSIEIRIVFSKVILYGYWNSLLIRTNIIIQILQKFLSNCDSHSCRILIGIIFKFLMDIGFWSQNQLTSPFYRWAHGRRKVHQRILGI